VDISLDLVMDAARRRLATLTPEVAGYVVLLAARDLEFRPHHISAETLVLGEAGDVHALPSEPATAAEVESALRGVLARLVALAPSPAPAITAVAERDTSGELGAFAAELSAALIPINHAAARRALARLYRETWRDRAGAQASADLDEGREVASAPELAPARSAPVPVVAREPVRSAAEAPREPFALAFDIDVDVETELPVVLEIQPAAMAEAEAPASVESNELRAEPEEPVGELASALESEPQHDPRVALPIERDEAVIEAPASRPEVVVPAPIIDLSPLERERVLPVAIIEASAPTIAIDAEPGAAETFAAPAKPLRVELQQPLEPVVQNGFARVAWSSLPPEDEALGIEDCRSDLQQLLGEFLAEARSEQRMTRGLRRLLGLEAALSTDGVAAHP
jgi:hypothetical protein